ncbi:MAG: DNA mismatch endonuclease Vsr [Sphingopyxis sp.]|nr:DNA mismatch endonuclease Vsr [Sphingopyxis sp.]
MVDHLDPEARSRNMGRIKGGNTVPELLVRRALHARGRRFRLHRRDLPGRPDIVLPRDRIALFVHGCFWHRHAGCPRTTMPSTRREFWEAKFRRTIARDAEQAAALAAAGWRVEIIWECEARKPSVLDTALDRILMVR